MSTRNKAHDAMRFELLEELFNDATTGRSERIIEDLGLEGEPHLLLSELVDQELIKRGKLASRKADEEKATREVIAAPRGTAG